MYLPREEHANKQACAVQWTQQHLLRLPQELDTDRHPSTNSSPREPAPHISLYLTCTFLGAVPGKPPHFPSGGEPPHPEGTLVPARWIVA